MAYNPDDPKPTVRLAPSGQDLLLEFPDGRQFPIKGTADGMDLLLGLLRRARARATNAVAQPLPVPAWPPGAEARFAPPYPSPWREAKFFPPRADSCPVVIVAEHKSGRVLCTAPDGHNYMLSPKHLRLAARAYDIKGREVLSLDDLGL